MADLPAGWVARESSSHPGRVYYYNAATQESKWDRPVAEPRTVRASHILVKHAGSRRPSSWRQATITLSKAEALAKLEGLRAAIVGGQRRFEQVAQEESDCSRCVRAVHMPRDARAYTRRTYACVHGVCERHRAVVTVTVTWAHRRPSSAASSAASAWCSTAVLFGMGQSPTPRLRPLPRPLQCEARRRPGAVWARADAEAV